MRGINLDRPIVYQHSSLRFFEENEHHTTRFCHDDVLLLVYEGILRFSEDGIEYEVHPGRYHIQKSNTYQRGDIASDSPKYLYVHFLADWSDDDAALPYAGEFNFKQLKPLIEELDRISHSDYTYTEKSKVFFELLSILYRGNMKGSTADKIAEFMAEEYLNIASLDDICSKFNFSKNHIINIFKKEYGMTPFEYINSLKIKRAMYLLEVTSNAIENIAIESGFNNYSHFYRLFCRKNRMSPAEWRNKIQTQPYAFVESRRKKYADIGISRFGG